MINFSLRNYFLFSKNAVDILTIKGIPHETKRAKNFRLFTKIYKNHGTQAD
jgi:hypothetical protein